MQKNVLEYLENIVNIKPDKVACSDEAHGLTFKTMYEQARSIGSFIADNGYEKEPVIVFMHKSPEMLSSFMGVIYSSCYHAAIDEEMPQFRIELIFKTLLPRLLICDDTTYELAKELGFEGTIVKFDDICTYKANDDKLLAIRDKQIDTDPIYMVFTSGSTGVPKGVIACHRSVIDYIENLVPVLNVTEDTVFGNQTPFYVDAYLKDFYPTLKFGASMVIIPKSNFMFPIKLVEFLNEHKVNTVCWVVSALTMISAFGTFKTIKPEYLHTIAFASEVFPIKQFNRWVEACPNARYINFYGPTETTGICTYYIVDRKFELGDAIPIGRPFNNTDILLLTDDNKLAKIGEPGEVCVRGTSLTMGYYGAWDKTNEAFTQNPLNDKYPELIYHTGDLAKLGEDGNLYFVSRKDHQIKHMGHRIELGEIETNVNMQDKINTSCCIYDNEKGKIVLYYVGDIEAKDLTNLLKEKLPRYMMPNLIRKIDTMPLTANGKIDRNTLKKEL